MKSNFKWTIQFGRNPSAINVTSTPFSATENVIWKLQLMVEENSPTAQFLFSLQELSGTPLITIPFDVSIQLFFLDERQKRIPLIDTLTGSPHLKNRSGQLMPLKFNFQKNALFENLVQNCLTLFCEIEFFVSAALSVSGHDPTIPLSNSDQMFGVRHEAHPGNSKGFFLPRYEMRTDFVIKARVSKDHPSKIKTFKVHKLILAKKIKKNAVSFLEKNHELVVQDFDADVVVEIVRFIYTGQVHRTVMTRMANKLLAAAEMYLMDELKTQCQEYLFLHMCPKMFLEFLLLPVYDTVGAPKLTRKLAFQYLPRFTPHAPPCLWRMANQRVARRLEKEDNNPENSN
jgi:hypothetical protein